jgi:hypothetical protein
MVSQARDHVNVSKNLNDYTSPGVYDLPIPEGTGWENYPVSGYSTLIVFTAWNVDTIQMFCQQTGDQYYIRKRTYNSTTWTAWAKIWTSSNDGPDSGLDADLLDGQHGSYYAPINNPTFTGTVTAPTPATETNNTQVATTAFVKNQNYEPNRGTGTNSLALGYNATASGNYSTALGWTSKASRYRSIALGAGSTASGDRSTALGSESTASGDYSTALGLFSSASELYSIALGYNAEASGTQSIALGAGTVASSDYQISIGTRFVYLRFASTDTEATVYNALSPWVNPTVPSSQGAMGSFGTQEVVRLRRPNSTTIELYDNSNTSFKTIRSGNTSTIGSDLAICTVIY